MQMLLIFHSIHLSPPRPGPAWIRPGAGGGIKPWTDEFRQAASRHGLAEKDEVVRFQQWDTDIDIHLPTRPGCAALTG